MKLGKRFAPLMVLGLLVASGCGSRHERAVRVLADQFFDHVQHGRLQNAYALLAKESQAVTSLEDFQAAVEASGMAGHQGVAWEAIYIDDDYGNATGVLTRHDGSLKRMEVVAFKKNRAWTIHMVHEASPSEPQVSDARVPDLPTQAEALTMTRDAVGHFIEAVHAGSMERFHQYVSKTLQQQASVAQFDENFLAFYELRDAGADFTVLNPMVPKLAESFGFSADGVLILNGSYDQPSPVVFELQFIAESGQFVLSGFNLHLQNVVDWVP